MLEERQARFRTDRAIGAEDEDDDENEDEG
jgi:hypothetical protein